MKKEEARGLLMRCEAESYCPHYLQKFNCDGCKQRIALDMAIEALYQQESADGEWIDSGEYPWSKCNKCGYTITCYQEEEFRYCPSCGVKMKGGAE